MGKWNAPVQFPAFFPERPSALFTEAYIRDLSCVMATPFKAT